MAKYCGNCGRQMRIIDRYCEKCGAKYSRGTKGNIDRAQQQFIRYPAPPRPKPPIYKRFSFYAVLLAATAVVFIFSLVAAGVIKLAGYIVNEYSVSVPKTQEEKSAMESCGDPVVFCGFYEITVEKAWVSKRAFDEEGKTVLYLSFSIRNAAAGTDIDTNTYLKDVLLYDYENNEYARIESPLAQNDIAGLVLKPGESVKGQMAFAVEQDFTDYVLTHMTNKYIDKRQILIPKEDIIHTQNDSVYFRMGEAIPYQDFEIVLQAARKVPHGEGHALYLRFTIRNVSTKSMSGNPFYSAAGLSSPDGLVFERFTNDPAPKLHTGMIPAGKMIEGEIAFVVKDTGEDFLFFLDTPDGSERFEALITKDQITR